MENKDNNVLGYPVDYNGTNNYVSTIENCVQDVMKKIHPNDKELINDSEIIENTQNECCDKIDESEPIKLGQWQVEHPDFMYNDKEEVDLLALRGDTEEHPKPLKKVLFIHPKPLKKVLFIHLKPRNYYKTMDGKKIFKVSHCQNKKYGIVCTDYCLNREENKLYPWCNFPKDEYYYIPTKSEIESFNDAIDEYNKEKEETVNALNGRSFITPCQYEPRNAERSKVIMEEIEQMDKEKGLSLDKVKNTEEQTLYMLKASKGIIGRNPWKTELEENKEKIKYLFKIVYEDDKSLKCCSAYDSTEYVSAYSMEDVMRYCLEPHNNEVKLPIVKIEKVHIKFTDITEK